MNRKRYRLLNSNHNVNLLDFEQEIIDTVNQVVPGKNPKVYKDYFEVDVLTQSESVILGRKLSSIKSLQQYGKTIETFRLFQGRILVEKSPKKQTNS